MVVYGTRTAKAITLAGRTQIVADNLVHGCRDAVLSRPPTSGDDASRQHIADTLKSMGLTPFSTSLRTRNLSLNGIIA